MNYDVILLSEHTNKHTYIHTYICTYIYHTPTEGNSTLQGTTRSWGRSRQATTDGDIWRIQLQVCSTAYKCLSNTLSNMQPDTPRPIPIQMLWNQFLPHMYWTYPRWAQTLSNMQGRQLWSVPKQGPEKVTQPTWCFLYTQWSRLQVERRTGRAAKPPEETCPLWWVRWVITLYGLALLHY